MHESVRQWVANVIGWRELRGKKVLEVGSYDENGSVREMFDATTYVGTDMRDGPGVDQVVNAHHLDAYFGAGEFDVVVCCEMLEHDERFWVSLRAMGHVLRQGGHLLITTRGNGFPHHAYPNDYWRFMPESGHVLLEEARCAVIESRLDPLPGHPGIFVLGVKR